MKIVFACIGLMALAVLVHSEVIISEDVPSETELTAQDIEESQNFLDSETSDSLRLTLSTRCSTVRCNRKCRSRRYASGRCVGIRCRCLGRRSAQDLQEDYF